MTSLTGPVCTVFGGMGETIDLGSSSNAFVSAERGGMSIRLGSSGADTIYALADANQPSIRVVFPQTRQAQFGKPFRVQFEVRVV